MSQGEFPGMAGATSGSSGRASAIPYRADIDGLRAIAVLSVVICHAKLGLLQGGYIGVDVFL